MSNSVCHQTYVVFTEFQMLSFFLITVKITLFPMTAHRKSSAKAGCYCSLHRPGTQRETVHLHNQRSGTTGEDLFSSITSLPFFGLFSLLKHTY